MKKEVVRSLLGEISVTYIIPRKFIKGCKLDEPGHVILEKVEEGILIRKLEE